MGRLDVDNAGPETRVRVILSLMKVPTAENLHGQRKSNHVPSAAPNQRWEGTTICMDVPQSGLKVDEAKIGARGAREKGSNAPPHTRARLPREKICFWVFA